MTEEQSRWWAALIGLVAGVAVLMLVSLALISFLTGRHEYLGTPVRWSETIMRLFFGTSR